MVYAYEFEDLCTSLQVHSQWYIPVKKQNRSKGFVRVGSGLVEHIIPMEGGYVEKERTDKGRSSKKMLPSIN